MRSLSIIGKNKLQIVEVPAIVVFIDYLADQLCVLTRHRWCHKYSRVATWAWSKETILVIIPITKPQYNILVDQNSAD